MKSKLEACVWMTIKEGMENLQNYKVLEILFLVSLPWLHTWMSLDSANMALSTVAVLICSSQFLIVKGISANVSSNDKISQDS
jgi:hypothetical protein